MTSTKSPDIAYNYYVNFIIFVTLYLEVNCNHDKILEVLDVAHEQKVKKAGNINLANHLISIYKVALPEFINQQSSLFPSLAKNSPFIEPNEKAEYIRLVALTALDNLLGDKVLIRQKLMDNHENLVVQRCDPNARAIANSIMQHFFSNFF